MSYLFAATLGLVGYFSYNKSIEYNNKKGGSRGYRNKNINLLFTDYRDQDKKKYSSEKIKGNFDGLTYIPISNNEGYLFVNHEISYPMGAVSRLIYKNGQIIKGEIWKDNLARPCSSHKTPWNTVLTNEEYISSDKTLGFVYELDPFNKNNFKRLSKLGRMWHENTLPVPDSSVPGGYVFLTTDDRSMVSQGGSLYKFVPDKEQDLTQGKLYVYQTDVKDGWLEDRVFGKWHLIEDPIEIKKNNLEGTPYYKMEDLEYNKRDNCVYICVGGMKDGNLGGIYKFNPKDNSMERWLKCENTQGKLINPDNIEIDNLGNLYIGEDKNVYNRSKYGNNRLVKINYLDPNQIEILLIGEDRIGEITGVLLNPEQDKLWVNWQNGYNNNLGYFNEIIEFNLK